MAWVVHGLSVCGAVGRCAAAAGTHHADGGVVDVAHDQAGFDVNE